MGKAEFLQQMKETVRFVFDSEFLVSPYKCSTQTARSRDLQITQRGRVLRHDFDLRFSPGGRIFDLSVGGIYGNPSCCRSVSASTKLQDYSGFFQISTTDFEIPRRRAGDLGIVAQYHDLANHPKAREVLALIGDQKVNFFTYDNPDDFNPVFDGRRPNEVLDGGMSFGSLIKLDKGEKLTLNWDGIVEKAVGDYASSFLGLPDTPAQVSDLSDRLDEVFDINKDHWQRGRLSDAIKSRIDVRANMFLAGLSRDLRRIIRNEEILPQFLGRVSYVVGETQYNPNIKTKLSTNLKLIPTREGVRVDVCITDRADTYCGNFGLSEYVHDDGPKTVRIERAIDEMASLVA